MRRGVPREIQSGETRVALTPRSLPILAHDGYNVMIESGADVLVFSPDAAYVAVGTRIAQDRVCVVGANDIVNPAARTKRDRSLHGMPGRKVDQAHTVMVLKRRLRLRPGFAGEANDLFYDRKMMNQLLKPTSATTAQAYTPNAPTSSSTGPGASVAALDAASGSL